MGFGLCTFFESADVDGLYGRHVDKVCREKGMVTTRSKAVSGYGMIMVVVEVGSKL